MTPMISVDLLTAINKTGLHGTITVFTVTLATGKSLAVEEAVASDVAQ
jgi:hypothetical protein